MAKGRTSKLEYTVPDYQSNHRKFKLIEQVVSGPAMKEVIVSAELNPTGLGKELTNYHAIPATAQSQIDLYQKTLKPVKQVENLKDFNKLIVYLGWLRPTCALLLRILLPLLIITMFHTILLPLFLSPISKLFYILVLNF